MDVFAPARARYASIGFEPCAPFGQYTVSPYNTWMTLDLDGRPESPEAIW
jgi:putative acetyltransferase